MAVRKTHNRVKEKDFFSRDINETIKKAKKYYAGGYEFYIFQIGESYYSNSHTLQVRIQ